MFDTVDIYNLQYWSTQIKGKPNKMAIRNHLSTKGINDSCVNQIITKFECSGRQEIEKYLQALRNMKIDSKLDGVLLVMR